MMDVKQHLLKELKTINRVFSQHGVGARVHAKRTAIAGSVYISYGVQLSPGETVERVERRLPELSEAITQLRQTPTLVRSQRLPFALEVPHPKPELLYPRHGMPSVPPHSMLLGRSFNPLEGGKHEVCTFSDFPHTLIAGTTDAGKSTLMNWMLLSLCRHTPPSELRLVLVDLKNEDLVPFKDLPHVERFAFDIDGATEAITNAHTEVRNRVATGRKPYRLLLVVDELAELSSEKQLLDLLGSYLGLGRSKWCNALVATQHPTADVLGRLGKANIRHRLGGLCVDAKASELVAARGQAGLHLLPGRGSFMRIHSSNMIRMQTYFLSDGYRQRLLDTIKNQWTRTAFPHTTRFPLRNVTDASATPAPAPLLTPPDATSSATLDATPAPLEYIGDRAITDGEYIAIHHAITHKTHSKNALQKLLFGSRNSRNLKRLNEAITDGETLLSRRQKDAQEMPQIQPQTITNGAKIIPLRKVA